MSYKMHLHTRALFTQPPKSKKRNRVQTRFCTLGGKLIGRVLTGNLLKRRILTEHHLGGNNLGENNLGRHPLSGHLLSRNNLCGNHRAGNRGGRYLLGGVLGVLMSSSAHAVIEKSLDESRLIEAPLSIQELTRIAVKGDRILNVYGPKGKYVLEADETLGQIFIRPLLETNLYETTLTGPPLPEANNALYLTLTTEKGHIQDLRLLPTDKPPESIILSIEVKENTVRETLLSSFNDSDNNHKATPHESFMREDLTREDVEDLMYACQEKRIPLGYKEVPILLSAVHESDFPLLKELRGESLRCLTYEVRNPSTAPLVLSEAELRESLQIKNVIALLLPKKTLTSGERISFYVVAKTH